MIITLRRGLYLRRLNCLVVILLFGLSGCTNLSQRPVVKPVITPQNQQAKLWQQRRAYLGNKLNWNLESKIALQFREEYWTFGLNWAQRALQQYAMQIRNPLTGAVVARLNHDRQGATLLANNGQRYHSRNAEQLLQQQTGLNLPLQGMQYWVRGLTSPQYKTDRLQLDQKGRPQLIQQAGWLIRYTNYEDNAPTALPRKMTLSRSQDKVQVKLVARQWQGS